MLSQVLIFLAIQAGIVAAAPLAAPTVKLDNATFTGASSGKVNKFLGIPFAQPP